MYFTINGRRENLMAIFLIVEVLSAKKTWPGLKTTDDCTPTGVTIYTLSMARGVVTKTLSLCQFSRSEFPFRGCGRFCQCNEPISLFQSVSCELWYFATCFFPLSIPVCILRLISCSWKGKRTLHPPPTFLFGTFRMDLQTSAGDSGE